MPPAPSPTPQQDDGLVTTTGIWSAAEKAGIVIGILGGLGTIAGFIWTQVNRIKKKRKRIEQAEAAVVKGGVARLQDPSDVRVMIDQNRR
jgi:hypothetical protein